MTDYVQGGEQEIELRPYVEAVLDNWYWILGLAVAGALLGLLLSFLVPPTYEATALVAVTEPRQRVQFDARIQTVEDVQPIQAYPELALSDEVLVDLLDQLPAEEQMTLTDLRKRVEAQPGSDPSILKLTVRNGNPMFAADLANTWAGLFVTWANQIYGDQGDEQLLFFEAQLAEAAEGLAASEQALVAFQARNRAAILDNELLAIAQTQADYLAKQRQTDLILQDIDSLLQQQDAGDTDQASIERLASVLLQIRALGGVANNVESTMPWQIQLNVDGQPGAGQGDQVAVLSDLRDMLLAQSTQIEERLSELEPRILAVQQEKQEADAEQNRLSRDFLVAEETYTTLARTVDEKRITSEDTTSGVKLASRTAVPEEPSSPNLLLNTIIAGIAGLLLGTLAVLILQWWHSDKERAEAATAVAGGTPPVASSPRMGTGGVE